MRNNFSKIALAAITVIAFVFTFSCSSDDSVGEPSSSSLGESSSSSALVLASSSSIEDRSSSSVANAGSSSSTIEIIPPLKAQPIATSKNGEPKVLESWIEENKNWYIIDVGYIENSLVMETDHERYEGLVEITFTKETTVENSISENRTTSVSNSIVVLNSLKEIIGIEAAIKASVKAKSPWVESSIESSLKSNHQISQTVSVSQEKATSTSESLIESFKKSEKDVLTLKLDRNVPAGYYRYAWYTTWDVYFVISTSLDNQELLSWDVVSCPRAVGTKGLEYSPDNKFDNSPISGSEIIFDEDFYKTLPKPTDTITYKTVVEKTEFTTAGNHTYIFDKGFPATIEIYALGAGGGGQGGYRFYRPALWSVYGTGGAGGGGAATYIKFEIQQSDTFNITVGQGGKGGDYVEKTAKLISGYKGKNGGNTKISWGSGVNTITALGGVGGGGDDDIINGGSGGKGNTEWPAVNLLEKGTDPGTKGTDGKTSGSSNEDKKSEGGNAGKIGIDPANPFGGGLGAYRQSGQRPSRKSGSGGGGAGEYGKEKGSNGGNGQVRIVVTYFEKDNGK